MNEFIQRPYPRFVIHPATDESLGVAWSRVAWSTAAWSAANRAQFVPFHIYQTITVQSLFTMNGNAVSGNMDIGIYTTDWKILTHTGAKAQAGTYRVQSFAIPTIELGAGSYYLGMSVDNTTATFFRRAGALNPGATIVGVAQQSTAFPLPELAAPGQVSTTNVYMMGLCTRSFV